MTESQPYSLLPPTGDEPDREAVRADGRTLTFAQLEERMRRVANGLAAEGVGPGDAWGLLGRNSIEWAELAMGNGRSGTRLVPLNWHLGPAELAELLADSGAKLLIVGADLADVGRKAARLAGIDRVIEWGEHYENWVEGHSDEPGSDRTLGSVMQYTGGTTGRSKGVLRSDAGGLVSELPARWGAWGGLVGMPTSGHALLCTPAYHALGGAVVRSSLARGHSLVMTDRWVPTETLSVIEEHRITTTAMVPTQFIRLLKLDEAERSRFDVSSLRWVLHTAAPCPPWAKQGMIDWFGPVIVELYGSSEGTGPVIATSEEWLARPGTVGRATAAVSISIVDDDGHDLPPGEVGTIYTKRNDGAPTYFGDPEKTDAMLLPDGRFTVGDVGWLDEDGFLYLADRRVDLIIRAGTNIYPAEIEACLSQHPDIVDVAVFGIPDEEMGQQVKAVVQPDEGRSLTETEVIEFARERLARFKVPQSVDFADELPREASGKLKKRLLREPYWSEA